MARKKSNSSLWLFVLAGVVFLGVIGVALVSKSAPGEYDDFAACLADQEVQVYSASWCPNCTRQKEAFGNSWRLVPDKECAAPGQTNNLALCQREGITAVPTWEFKDGSRVTGVQPFENLVAVTGCQLDGSFVDPMAEAAPDTNEDAALDVSDTLEVGAVTIGTEANGEVTITPIEE